MNLPIEPDVDTCIALCLAKTIDRGCANVDVEALRSISERVRIVRRDPTKQDLADRRHHYGVLFLRARDHHRKEGLVFSEGCARSVDRQREGSPSDRGEAEGAAREAEVSNFKQRVHM